MRKHHPANERIKREYLTYLTDAKRMSVKSVDQVAAAIAAFEVSTGHKDFKAFHIEQARRFKRQLGDHHNSQTGKPLAVATIKTRLMAVKAFFQWLAGRQGYRRISYADAEYFNPSAHDSRIASATRDRPVPSIEQIRRVIEVMPTGTDIEKRNRALIALTLLTGARDDAIASLSIRHIDIAASKIDQDARQVRTKYRKTFTTWFFPVGDDIEAIVHEWISHLTKTLLFGPDDPLFPATRLAVGANGGFEAAGLDRKHWTTAGPIRDIFKLAFHAAGLPYFNPHSFRSTLGRLGEKVCPNPEAFKAWSQNLGHEGVLTTFTSYGTVSSHRQSEIIAAMRQGSDAAECAPPQPETIARVLAHLARQQALSK